MPLPKTRNVGKIIRKLKKEGGRPHKQIVAIALSQARKSGAKIPKRSGKVKHKGKTIYESSQQRK